MKKLKQIITRVKTDPPSDPNEFTELLWQLICYSPKMSVRLQQQQLLDEAEKFSLKVSDDYFAKQELKFNGFKWGNGNRKVLITHGWGSKAADFTELIAALREIDDLQIIAFDAPGNGSSEGELSNLLLFILAVKAIVSAYGTPDIWIGHSLGGMANVMAVKEIGISPPLMISLTPLIRLKENFEASMNAADVPQIAQGKFLADFEHKFGKPASYYNLIDWYPTNVPFKHWLAHDRHDLVSTYDYMEEFLNSNPSIISQEHEGVGHERIIKSEAVINDIVTLIKAG
ncbi:MAG TPA: alpha/beta hydrolase [Mucilaginibacter sp.]|nr:alpha/beta hydrolase [Mucilaginibacter sp.]